MRITSPAISLPCFGGRPERIRQREGPLDRLWSAAGGRIVAWRGDARTRRLAAILPRVAAAEAEFAGLPDRLLRDRALDCARQLRRQPGFNVAAVAPAYALVRIAAERRLGLRPFDVQILGAHALTRGLLAEMRTGEGKSLTATLPAIVAAMAGLPVHIVTVSDHLAIRDAAAFAPLFAFFGLTVGTVVQGLEPAARRAAYAADVTYCTNKEVAFDHLRDRLIGGRRSGALRQKLAALGEPDENPEPLLRGLRYAIVDEADSVLIDEARTPLMISRPAKAAGGAALFELALDAAARLRPGEDYALDPALRRIDIMPAGRLRLSEEAGSGPWLVPMLREELIVQALTAQYFCRRDEHYLVRDGRVQIVDEYTGRVMADRFWSLGFQQMIEAKEGVPLTGDRETLGRMTYQRFFRRYERLAGMTGTATEVAGELWQVYRLPIARIPTNRPSQRVDCPDRILPTGREKWQAIMTLVAELHARGAPVLLGTRSVAAAATASSALEAAGVPHVVLSAAQDETESLIVARAGEPGRVTVATNMAGRGTDIRLPAGAAELGGLHVIMSERHDAGRIDRQLLGRAARQGEPGWAIAMLSMEDPILETAGLARLGRLVGLLLPVLGEAPARWLLTTAQRRVERRHARMRQELLRQDEVLGESLAFAGEPE